MKRATKADPVLLAASAVFAGACAFGSAAATRHGVRGQPLGVSVPLTVPVGLLLGWGAGVAAPWPMPVAALVAAARAGRPTSGAAPGYVCAGLGIACIAGTLVEPVTCHPRSWTPAIRTAIQLNLVCSAALVVAGLRHAGRRRSHR